MAHVKVRFPECLKIGDARAAFGTQFSVVNDDGSETPIPGVRTGVIRLNYTSCVTLELEMLQLELPEDIIAKLTNAVFIQIKQEE